MYMLSICYIGKFHPPTKQKKHIPTINEKLKKKPYILKPKKIYIPTTNNQQSNINIIIFIIIKQIKTHILQAITKNHQKTFAPVDRRSFEVFASTSSVPISSACQVRPVNVVRARAWASQRMGHEKWGLPTLICGFLAVFGGFLSALWTFCLLYFFLVLRISGDWLFLALLGPY